MRSAWLNPSQRRRLAVGLMLAALCLPAVAQSGATCVPARPTVAIDPAQPAVIIDTAERIGADGRIERVSLPEFVESEAGAAFVERRYRLPVEPAQSLYLSAVFGHPRIALNGEVLLDTITEPLAQEPRSSKRQRLLSLPPCLLLPAGNRIEITLRSKRYVGVPKVMVGGYDTLHDLRNHKTYWMSTAPAGASAMMAFLGASVLLIWARRRSESIYLYFGVAALAWSVHTAWSVSTQAWLPDPHQAVWWNSLYAFVVAMLVTFGLHFSGYRMHRVERALLWAVVATPPLLYLGAGLGALDSFATAVRLCMVLAACAGLAAVVLAAVRERSVGSLLLVVAAIAAVGLGARDWWVFTFGDDLMPVQWAPFAGLPFVVLVTWFLIDRFIVTNESLEQLNRELEQRVRAKSAELMTALDHMRAARDGAETANRGKTGFLAAASHDLRQPIHALGLYMGSLRQRPLEAGAREIVDRMDGSVAALESLLNALLDISRIDAGVLVPQPRPFDLSALLHRLGDEFSHEAGARALRLSVRVSGAAPARATADPMLVERVLRNLIANAVKYTQQGGVLVTCRLRGAGAPLPQWRVEVWDTGPGIAAHEQERVFEEFYQAGNPERDRRGGLGLGLAIVRRLARLMKLPLALHSRPGHGSRFALDLPAFTQALGEAPADDEKQALSRVVVAVIDDDAEVRDAMRSLLHSWQCDVLDGADADDVMRSVREGRPPPEVVVADLRLRGGRDGVAEVARLRAAFGAHLPALLVSGDSAPERVRVMQDSGLPWLAKPVSPARLRSWLAGVGRLADPVEVPT
jgi:signal transduction histidine kinase/CheY-like chemotaxis protein